MRFIKCSVMVLLVAALAGCGPSSPKPSPSTVPTTTPSPSLSPTPTATPGPTSQTTGVSTVGKAKLGIAVMIENSPDARPHSGLSKADIVYEMKTEAQISRYMAIFHDHIPEKIGPVRSARHYFVPLAQEWNVPYVHYGGSWYAYEALKKTSLPTVDGVSSGYPNFMRDNSRKAPHNAYLVTQKLQLEPTTLSSHFNFNREVNPMSTTPATTIAFSYNSYTHIRYDYDASTQSYKRFQEEKPQTDLLDGSQVTTQNIAFITAVHKPVLNDAKGRIDINFISSGALSLFRDGVRIDGTWKKESEASPMQFLDNNGEEINFHPGKTWVQVIESTQTINVK